jgi:hypothetical protein
VRVSDGSGGGPAAAAGTGRRGHDDVDAIPRPASRVVMPADGDWHESPARLQAMVFCCLQQARPGDA